MCEKMRLKMKDCVVAVVPKVVVVVVALAFKECNFSWREVISKHLPQKNL